METMKKLLLLLIFAFATPAWAQLPPEDSVFAIEGQICPLDPSDRARLVHIYYPGGRLANVGPSTGICVVLHNWGGTGWEGSAHPVLVANYLNCVTITVDYFQSGEDAYGPLPYDHGLYQATDVINALWFVFWNLRARGAFDSQRIIGIGGSGGGNVLGMVHRLMPRTFSAMVLMSAPINPKFGPPLDSRWTYLAPHEFRIRDLADAQLNAITRSFSRTQIRMIHGRLDQFVPYADVVSAASTLGASLLTVEPWGLWGPYQDPYHSIGDRTLIAFHDFQWPLYWVRRPGLTDLELFDTRVQYPVPGGAWVMDYRTAPTLRWVPR